jgi:serine/threonine protein kinase
MDEIKEQIKDKNNLKFVGKGQFGVVYKLVYQGKEFAIKKISKELIKTYNGGSLIAYLEKAVQQEVNILRKMSEYENSVRFYGYYDDEEDHILILEFCETDLGHLLQKKKNLVVQKY